jgi:hypothetical protein
MTDAEIKRNRNVVNISRKIEDDDGHINADLELFFQRFGISHAIFGVLQGKMMLICV